MKIRIKAVSKVCQNCATVPDLCQYFRSLSFTFAHFWKNKKIAETLDFTGFPLILRLCASGGSNPAHPD